MAVKQEIWVPYILNRLEKANGFLANAYSDDQYVLEGSVVHIPQPGAKPVVVKNRSSYPATAVRRTDTDVTYVLDEYTTDPTHIVNADKYELSYSKMDSVMLDHVNGLAETIGDDILIKWLSGAGHVIYTSGAASAEDIEDGMVGMRKTLHYSDLARAKKYFNKQNVLKTDRFAVLEENMFDQLCSSLGANGYKDFSAYANPVEGVLGKWEGFNIQTRSSVAISGAADAINALGAEIGEDDNVCSILYQKDCVARAKGTIELFQDEGNPLYYGDIYSALVRMGGRVRRSGGMGVIKLVAKA